MSRYTLYSDYLTEKYGGKTYKISLRVEGTCPNRDGTLDTEGCIFCNEEGGSYENLTGCLSIKNQMERNKKFMKKRYNAVYFMAYFQNYTNTYMPLEKFKEMILEAIEGDIVAIIISTRPDAICKEQLDFLEEVREKYKIDILFEIGLQSSNNETLEILNRHHTVEDFINSFKLLKERNFEICAHFISGLPWDTDEDLIHAANLLSDLKIDEVKIHSLYIPKETVIGQMYEKGEIKMKTEEEYIEEAVLFLRHLDPFIKIQRLVGQAPRGEAYFCNWGKSWWLIKEAIEERLEVLDAYQGDLRS